MRILIIVGFLLYGLQSLWIFGNHTSVTEYWDLANEDLLFGTFATLVATGLCQKKNWARILSMGWMLFAFIQAVRLVLIAPGALGLSLILSPFIGTSPLSLWLLTGLSLFCACLFPLIIFCHLFSAKSRALHQSERRNDLFLLPVCICLFALSHLEESLPPTYKHKKDMRSLNGLFK